MDVRDPAEYRAGHLPGSAMAPGGQLVQETDNWLGVWGARVVLVDDTGVRARMTASWLRRMGWDAAVLDGGLDHAELEQGTPVPKSNIFPLAGPEPVAMPPSELHASPGQRAGRHLVSGPRPSARRTRALHARVSRLGDRPRQPDRPRRRLPLPPRSGGVSLGFEIASSLRSSQ